MRWEIWGGREQGASGDAGKASRCAPKAQPCRAPPLPGPPLRTSKFAFQDKGGGPGDGGRWQASAWAASSTAMNRARGRYAPPMG